MKNSMMNYLFLTSLRWVDQPHANGDIPTAGIPSERKKKEKKFEAHEDQVLKTDIFNFISVKSQTSC